MKKNLLDWDAETRTATYHYYDESKDMTYIEEVQDLRPYAEELKRFRSGLGGKGHLNSYERQGIKNNMMHVATVPNSVLVDWMRKGIDVFGRNSAAEIKKELNKSDMKPFRTGNARL